MIARSDDFTPLKWQYQLVSENLSFLSKLSDERPLNIRPQVLEQRLETTFDLTETILEKIRHPSDLQADELKALETMLTNIHKLMSEKMLDGFLMYGGIQNFDMLSRIQVYYQTLESRIATRAKLVATSAEIEKIRLDQKNPDVDLLSNVAKRDPAMFFYVKILFDGFEHLQKNLNSQHANCSLVYGILNFGCMTAAMASAYAYGNDFYGLSVSMLGVLAIFATKAASPEIKNMRKVGKELRLHQKNYHKIISDSQAAKNTFVGPFSCSALLKATRP